MTEDTNPADRSLSRGREPVISFGRGGFGNMRPSSTSRSRGPDDRRSLERGRVTNRVMPTDGIDAVPEDSVSHSRSPVRPGLNSISDLGSPDIEPPIHITRAEDEKVSTGRGGAGNIRDRSQSKVRDGPEPHLRHSPRPGELYSSGRGGAGNIRSVSRSKEEMDQDHKPIDLERVLHKVIHPYH